MRRKKNNKLVGIYLWKLILIIITIFVVFISIECFFLIEKTVRKFVSGFSEKYTTSASTDLNENIINNIDEKKEDADTTNDGSNLEKFESISSDGVEANDTATATNVEATVDVSNTLYCTEAHTHKNVCYVNIPHTDRMAIYNLINDINSLPLYSTVLNNLKSYTTNYDNYSSDNYYNYYKSYLDSNCPRIEATYNTMNSINSSYYDYIENREELTKLHRTLKFREIFNLLNAIPRRGEINNKMTELKNTQNSTEIINYLTVLSNTVISVYQSFVTNILPSIDSSWYEYIINYNNMLELKSMSDNLSKITICINAIKDLPKWEDVAKQIEINKTDKATYMSYLQNLSTTVNQVEATFTSQNLDSNSYTYVINYDNYKNLLNIPKIWNCAQIIDKLPAYEEVTQKINEYKHNNQVDECIAYLTEISSQVNDVYSKFIAEKLSSTYNTYVINYENLNKLYDMHFDEILNFTNQIKDLDLPQCEEITSKIINYKESNDVSGCITYLNKIISTNYEKIYSDLINSINLKQSHYTYIINYENIKKVYDLQLKRIINLINEIEELPPLSEINFSDSKMRSKVIAVSQRYKKFSIENQQLSEYIINYDKMRELQTQLNNLDKEINIKVQYYAYINIIDNITKPEGSISTINFIDTSGASMPINRGFAQTNKNQLNESPTNNPIKYAYVDNSTGDVIFEKQLREVYRTHEYNFNRYFEDFYVDNMLNFTTFYNLLTTNYELIEIWLLQDDKSSDSIDKNDFNCYTYTDDVYFTRNMNDLNPKAIRLTKDAVVRYVYNTKSIENGVNVPVTFYDYDITSGVIYNSESDARSKINQKNTSSQRLDMTAYALTAAEGINNDKNYTKPGARLGFGGINTGVTRNSDKWVHNRVENALSGPNRIGGYGTPSNSYQNCVFNIVQGIDEEKGILKYSEGISAPNLFNEGNAIGKKTYTDYSLKFNRTGDRYLLTQVNGTNTTDLDKLVNPNEKYPSIVTNNFWPMDDVESYGTDGHDLKFGMIAQKEMRRFVGQTNGAFPPSDNMDKDHNAYFGMRGEIEFDLSPEYVGPLEWHFYGDDDLWIFLDDQLIIDIGGVHTSVGEYANFWDYLTPGDSGHHKITFFFTERGASGSTCWMRFALPEIEAKESNPTKGNLRIEKSVVGLDTNENFDFVVNFKDKNSLELNEYFYYAKYNVNGTKLKEELFKSGGTISFNKDEYIIIENIPSGITYSIEETANPDFIVQSKDSNGNIVAGQTVTAKFVNTFGTKSVRAIKQWEDNNMIENRPEELYVKLVPKISDVATPESPSETETESIITDEVEETVEPDIGEEETEAEEDTSVEENTTDNITGEEYFNQYYPSIDLIVPLNETNNWSYEWEALPRYRPIYDETGENIIDKQEIEYSVEEIYTNELTEIYYPLPTYQNENGNFILTNVLYKKIEVIKKDADDGNIRLGGAEFKLQKLKEVDGELIADPNEKPIYGKTLFEQDNLGKVTFNKLKDGIYRLTEEKAPDGYNINKKVMEIEITPTTELVTSVEFKNKKGAVLPFTGGAGINLFITSGLAIVILTILRLRKINLANSKPKRRRRKPIK